MHNRIKLRDAWESDNTRIFIVHQLFFAAYSITDSKYIIAGNLSPVEWKSYDRKMKELYDAPIWVNDIEIESIENYKSAEDVIINEKIKYVFIDSLPETIDKSDIIKWGENVGFNVYFTKIAYE